MSGDRAREQEGLQMHTNFSQTLMKDHFVAIEMPEHNLIKWTDGPLPPTETLRQSATGAGGASNTSQANTAATTPVPATSSGRGVP